MRKPMHQGTLASNCLLLHCAASFAVLNDKYRNLLARKYPNLGDGSDGCTVRAFLPARSNVERWSSAVN